MQKDMSRRDREYLRLIREKYPTVQAAATEMINIEAILRLPKGTEHFMSDLHGEYEAFCHIVNNCSGVIREKVERLYGKTMSKRERDEFATLIYYPAAIIGEKKAQRAAGKAWFLLQLHRLVEVCRSVASKYTRSKVRKALPPYFDYIIDERGRELYLECVRRTDLIRFGRFTSDHYLWQWKGGVLAGRGVDSRYNVYPIPANEIAVNSNLSNPNY